MKLLSELPPVLDFCHSAGSAFLISHILTSLVARHGPQQARLGLVGLVTPHGTSS